MFQYTLKGLTVLHSPYFQFWLIFFFLTVRKACCDIELGKRNVGRDQILEEMGILN